MTHKCQKTHKKAMGKTRMKIMMTIKMMVTKRMKMDRKRRRSATMKVIMSKK